MQDAHIIIPSENVLLIKPSVDASNNQLHYKNEFRFAGKNFDKFLNQGETIDNQGFKPSNLGKHSKHVRSVKVNIKDGNVIEPDFKRNIYGDCGKVEELDDFRRAKKIA